MPKYIHEIVRRVKKNMAFSVPFQNMERMRNKDLPTKEEMLTYGKEVFGQDDSLEGRFLDAFNHGEYHEEEFDWVSISEKLSKRELASLYLSVCKALIAGSVEFRTGEPLEKIMNLFWVLGKWEKSHLKTTSEILNALDDVRPIIKSFSKESPGWIEVVPVFKMIDLGVRRRMGVFSSYN